MADIVKLVPTTETAPKDVLKTALRRFDHVVVVGLSGDKIDYVTDIESFAEINWMLDQVKDMLRAEANDE